MKRDDSPTHTLLNVPPNRISPIDSSREHLPDEYTRSPQLYPQIPSAGLGMGIGEDSTLNFWKLVETSLLLSFMRYGQ